MGNGITFKKPSETAMQDMIGSYANLMASNKVDESFLNSSTLPNAPTIPQKPSNLNDIIPLILSGNQTNIPQIDTALKSNKPEDIIKGFKEGKNYGSSDIMNMINNYQSTRNALGDNGAIKEQINKASVQQDNAIQNVPQQAAEPPENDIKNIALDYAKKYLSQGIAKPETTDTAISDLLSNFKGGNIGGAIKELGDVAGTSGYSNFAGDIMSLFGKGDISRQLYSQGEAKKAQETEATNTYNKSLEDKYKNNMDLFKLLSDLGIKKEEIGETKRHNIAGETQNQNELEFDKDKFNQELAFNKQKWNAEFDLEGKKFTYEQRKDKIEQAFKEKELDTNSYIALSKLNEERRHNKVAEGISQQNANSSALTAMTKANGAGGYKLPASQVAEISDLKTSSELLKDFSKNIDSINDDNMFKPIIGGAYVAIKDKTGDPNAKAYLSQITLLKQIIGKGLEGGVLRQEDTKKYNDILGSPGATKAQLKQIGADIKKTIDKKIDQRITDYENANYNIGELRGNQSSSGGDVVQNLINKYKGGK